MIHPLGNRPISYTSDPNRLAELEAYGILDTAPEEGFDDVVEIARLICEAPVALVSLVARDRQWFKARVGFAPCETDLNSSVCAYALSEPDLLIIPDLTADLEWAPDGGHDQAAVLTVCRACCFSNCTGLR